MLLVCQNVLAGVSDSVVMLIVVFSAAPNLSDVVSIADDAKYNCCGLFVFPAIV